MTPVPFAASPRSTVGLEWELMLADRDSGQLVGRGPEVVAALAEQSARSRHTVTGELLTNTVEVTSGIGATVAEAAADIAAGVEALSAYTGPRGIDLLSAGSHPFAQWYDQEISDATRYHRLIERTQWWGRNMMIWGVHVHVGIEDVAKVIPIVNAMTAYLPHLQALTASSPFWAGERTGYASNRALVFQQLPTAGLPWQLEDWGHFERYLDDMNRTGVMRDATEVRWDIRPAPRWGTIEVRVCDATSTAAELSAVAALVQCLVESASRELDEGRALRPLPVWFTRENKWRAARYGLEAQVIVDDDGRQAPVRRHLEDTLDRLAPIAADLDCVVELDGVRRILREGAGYARQTRVADAAEGDLREVVRHLVGEFTSTP